MIEINAVEWLSLVMGIKKKKQAVLYCVDLCEANKVNAIDSHILGKYFQNLEELSSRLQRKYWVLLDKESRDLTETVLFQTLWINTQLFSKTDVFNP